MVEKELPPEENLELDKEGEEALKKKAEDLEAGE